MFDCICLLKLECGLNLQIEPKVTRDTSPARQSSPQDERLSPDSTSDILAPPTLASPLKKKSLLRKLKGVAKSFTSLTETGKAVIKSSSLRLDSTSRKSNANLRRTSRKPVVIHGSPAKKRRHGSAIESFVGKRMRLSAPCVQLTKISAIGESETRACLRPRVK